MDYSNYKIIGNFGELILNVNGTEATGTYEQNGTLKGAFINNTFLDFTLSLNSDKLKDHGFLWRIKPDSIDKLYLFNEEILIK